MSTMNPNSQVYLRLRLEIHVPNLMNAGYLEAEFFFLPRI